MVSVGLLLRNFWWLSYKFIDSCLTGKILQLLIIVLTTTVTLIKTSHEKSNDKSNYFLFVHKIVVLD